MRLDDVLDQLVHEPQDLHWPAVGLYLIFFLGTIVVSGVINMYGGIVILWYAMYRLFDDLGFRKGDGYVGYMSGGHRFHFHIKRLCDAVFADDSARVGLCRCSSAGITVPYGAWIIIGPIFMLAMITGYVLVGKFLLRLNVEPLKAAGDRYQDLRSKKINSQQKFGIVVLMTFVSIVILPTFLPAGNALKVMLSHYGGMGAAIVCVCLACIFKRDDDDFAFGKMIYQGVGWDLIVLLAATMPLCAAMESADTGIVATVLAILGPLVLGLSPFAYLAAVLVILD